MSPVIFTLYSDIQLRLIVRSKAIGKLNGVKVSHTCPKITHLMYPDDLVIYCKVIEMEANEVHQCLQTYCEWTRQAINWEKSTVHFSRNVHEPLRRKLCRIMGMTECNHKGKYLGYIFCGSKSKREAFKDLREKWP